MKNVTELQSAILNSYDRLEQGIETILGLAEIAKNNCEFPSPLTKSDFCKLLGGLSEDIIIEGWQLQRELRELKSAADTMIE